MTAHEFGSGSGFNPPIVVGLDGSTASLAALAWAHDEAVAHDAPLVVVHVLDPRSHAASYAPTHVRRDEDARAAAEADALIAIESTSPVEHVFEVGIPSVVLVQRSRGARMLVLGHSERHRHADRAAADTRVEPALGPVSRACVAQATCPVVVLPEAVLAPSKESESASAHGEPVRGGRALYPFQGRIPIAHH